MSLFNDLAPLDYFGEGAASVLVAIGWLDRVTPFTLGAIDPKVFQRLSRLFENSFEPVECLGFHQCDICQGQMGSRNLFIPGDGFLYVCPELITHYIETHNYLPPEPFCAAVVRCPDTRSRKYRRLFLSNGGLHLFEELAKRIGEADFKKTLRRLKRGAF